MMVCIVTLSLSRMVFSAVGTLSYHSGRVENRTELQAKSGLLEIARYMLETRSGHLRLTGNQHVILAGITSEQLPHVKDVLAKYKLDNLNFSGLRLSS
jgi:sulfite reductase (NADPH) hemoprotein beta-component